MVRQLVVPRVHLNGDTRQTLVGDLEAGRNALAEAIGKIADGWPNARNYEHRQFERARIEHQDRLNRLRSVYEELGAIWEGILDGKTEVVYEQRHEM